MILNFNFAFTDLNGNNISDQEGNIILANKLLANLLAQLSKGNSIKLIDIALKLNDGKELDLDKSDADMLKDLIEQTDLQNILKYRLLNVF